MIYLSLCEVEGDGDLVPPEPRQVVVVAELALQVRDLTLGEGGALLAVPVCEELKNMMDNLVADFGYLASSLIKQKLNNTK